MSTLDDEWPFLRSLKWSSDGLVPAIVQDAESGAVLMMAWMDEPAIRRTLATGQTHFYSRSRKASWHKGGTSGHVQHVESIHVDCDGDVLLVRARQVGGACHEGYRSCFWRRVDAQGGLEVVEPLVFEADAVYANKAASGRPSDEEPALQTPAQSPLIDLQHTRRSDRDPTPPGPSPRIASMPTVLNFNAGPAALPQTVLEKVQAELLDYQGRGMSIMEMSHRSKEYEAINDRAEADFKRLIGVGDGYRVLFVQGGASTQFATVPMNFLTKEGTADYVVTGTWGEKAIEEGAAFGKAHLAASTKEGGYRRVPASGEIKLSPGASYVHLTSNETIQGVQFGALPEVGDAPLVADMSSDILSGPIDTRRFSLIYAGAQKNLGPSGVTVVLIRESFLERANKGVPTMLRYSTHAKNNSLYNTPPMFGVYVLDLVLQWVDGLGGVAGMAARNDAKAAAIYGAIDGSGGYYKGHAEPGSRSKMNVTFRLPGEDLEKKFVAEAKDAGMVGLAGHRSVGGIRASIYNAIDVDACTALASFMGDFARKNG